MIPLQKHIRFFVVFLLFTVCVAVVRVYWIHKALPSKAVVLYIDQTRHIRYSQKFPVVNYETTKGLVETRGTYNLPVKPGQTIAILYNPDKVEEFRINTSYWLWYDIWSWYRLILVAIALYFIALFFVKRSFRKEADAAIVEKEQGGPLYPDVSYYSQENDKEEVATVTKSTVHVKKRSRLSLIVKVLLLFLLPIAIILAGQIWNIPYASQVGVIIFLGYAGLISKASPDSDPGPDL